MYALIEWVNAWGASFTASAAAMLMQSSILIACVLVLDLAIRKRVRAVFRYWIWVLVLFKLVLPPTLSAPYSAGYWLAGSMARIESLWSKPPSQPPTQMNSLFTAPQATHAIPPRQEATITCRQAVQQIDNTETSPAPTGRHASAAVQDAVADRPDSSAAVTASGVVFVFWCLVCAAMAALVVHRTRAIRKIVCRSTQADAALADLLTSCCERMRMRAHVNIRITSALSSPAVYGIVRPVVLIPAAVRNRMSLADLEIIVSHELIHVRRGDLSIKLLQTILQVVYFYNPLLWPVNAMIRRIREQAVDETVLATLGPQAITTYARALVQVAGMAFGRPGLELRLIGVVESKSLLTERIRIMLHKSTPVSAKLNVFGLTALAMLAAFLLPMARAEEKPVASSSFVAQEAHALPAVGGNLKSLEGQIAELKKELHGRMEMLRLLEGKLKLAHLEHVTQRSVDMPAAPFSSAALQPALPPMAVPDRPETPVFSETAEDGGTPPQAAQCPELPISVVPPLAPWRSAAHSWDGQQHNMSSEVSEAVRAALPEALKEMLPTVIEDIIAKIQMKFAGRP